MYGHHKPYSTEEELLTKSIEDEELSPPQANKIRATTKNQNIFIAEFTTFLSSLLI